MEASPKPTAYLPNVKIGGIKGRNKERKIDVDSTQAEEEFSCT